MVEITSILTATFATLTLAKSCYVVNLGYTSVKPGTIEAEVDSFTLLQSAMVQVAAEIVVDTICFWSEQRQGIPVVGWYFERLAESWPMVLCKFKFRR